MGRSKYNLQQQELASKAFVISRFFMRNLRSTIVLVLAACAIFSFNMYSEKSFGSYCDLVLTKSYYYSSIPLHWFNSCIEEGRGMISAITQTHNLQKENDYLKQQLIEKEILEQQNKELKKIAHYINHTKYTYISARVIASNTDILGTKLTINAGSADGIRDGNVVINSEGMVGRVTDISQYSSRVLLITDNILKIPVLLLKSGLHCIVGEQDAHGMLKIIYKLDKTHIPISGEQAISSGEDGNLPFGIKIGTIVQTPTGDLMLKPNVDFSKLALVSVLQAEVNNNEEVVK